MELLEREDALRALMAAWSSAAGGEGRAVVVSGEPGIGKTSLVARFVGDLSPRARVLLGACDDLSTPRPLGAIRDLLGAAAPALRAAVEDGLPPHEIQRLLLVELERPPRPTLLVVEDVHWADDATLDAISVLGRRIGSLPAVLVLTLRGGEVAPGHPLRVTLGAIPRDNAIELELEPLTQAAVESLAGERDGGAVYRATGGNPFYVSELLAAGGLTDVPSSVATAVLARTSRLESPSRDLLDLVSVVPGRVPTDLLDALRPGWARAAVEPERRGLLRVDPGQVRFRHELARHAIASSITSARDRQLHLEILSVLIELDADPADIVHHAAAAGARDVESSHILPAARRALSLGSNREACAHLLRASEILIDRPPSERAAVLEELANVAYLVARLDDAFAAIHRAIALFRELGDDAAVGRCLRVLSRLHWYSGNGEAADRAARDAVRILEPLGDTAELARAYSAISQLAMLAEDTDAAIEWGGSALALAQRLGDEAIRAHAMINLGTARMFRDPDASVELHEAHELAAGVGDHHEATRALANVAYSLMSWVRPADAMATARRALAYAEEHEIDALARYVSLVIARLEFRTGTADADALARTARRSLERDSGVTQLVARVLQAELASQRGDPDADDLVAALLAQAKRTGEPQRIEPALELATQAALFRGGPPPEAELRALLDRLPAAGRFRTRTRAWMAISGLATYPDESANMPHAALARGDWRTAADGFGAVGWSYDRAIALTLLDDEAALTEALKIARAHKAAPLARRAMERLRLLGFAIPRGRRTTTREHAFGLTAREQEVLELLLEGLTNADIAARLVLSRRTAEHHVTAVLGKLGAATRREVIGRAAEFGVAPAERVGGVRVSGA